MINDLLQNNDGLRVCSFQKALEKIKQRQKGTIPAEVPVMLETIRREGDAAVKRYARDLDGFKGETFEIGKREMQRALKELKPDLRRHLETAIERVREMAEQQRGMFRDMQMEIRGTVMGHRIAPIERAACYAPGGRYPLPSSVIMGVVPARVAGVQEISVLSPRIHPVTLAAAVLAGADRVFNLGGVQGVAAAAWGLAGVPKADLIVGPGNKYVTAAKRLLYGEVGIDFPAGPSELLIIAEEAADPAVLAADLLAQAEHDPDAMPVLIGFSSLLLQKVNRAIREQLEALPSDSPARQSLKNGFALCATSDQEAITLADNLAPEHLELVGKRAEALSDRLQQFGSLFIGSRSAEVFGDYGSGTNHILPTNGAARFTGGVWVGTFLRVLTWQKVKAEGLPALIDQAGTLADAEGLPAHAVSARIRLKK
ncbi:MAG: histidinol dehydrogenase [Desulfobacteraceae bacterium]|nr:MAG: histidinol dehydrogenase [Desulfobacteraceae bacterium]